MSELFDNGVGGGFPDPRAAGGSRHRGERVTSRAGLLALLALCLAAAGVPLPAEARSERVRATVFVVRGGGGFCPDLGKIAEEKFGTRGLVAKNYFFNDRASAARDIIEAYRKGRLPEGVYLVGYSLGGVGAIRVARILEGARVPVRQLVIVETINPAQTVPGNVRECVNLYHFPALFGGPVRADSKKTDLLNLRVVRDAGIEQVYLHPLVPFAGEVHAFVTGQVLRALSGKPVPRSLRKAAPDTGW